MDWRKQNQILDINQTPRGRKEENKKKIRTYVYIYRSQFRMGKELFFVVLCQTFTIAIDSKRNYNLILLKVVSK